MDSTKWKKIEQNEHTHTKEKLLIFIFGRKIKFIDMILKHNNEITTWFVDCFELSYQSFYEIVAKYTEI